MYACCLLYIECALEKGTAKESFFRPDHPKGLQWMTVTGRIFLWEAGIPRSGKKYTE
jgi:hypothetical protein